MAKFNNAALVAALEGQKPEVAASYIGIVHRLFARMIEKFGPSLKGVSNDWNFARPYSQTVSRFVKRDGDRINSVCSLNEERLAQFAEEYAEAVVKEWLLKIHEKLGELETAEVPRFSGDRFVIVGTRGGKKVVIEQDRITNVSSNGVVFNQFPARLYVDGKFYSAAKYKKLFAEAA